MNRMFIRIFHDNGNNDTRKSIQDTLKRRLPMAMDVYVADLTQNYGFYYVEVNSLIRHSDEFLQSVIGEYTQPGKIKPEVFHVKE